MTIQEYMDLINDWNSSVPMSTSILISKALRKFLHTYTKYNESSEINSDIVNKLKEIILRENGKTAQDEAFVYIDGFIGQPEE